jgi:hypothetical protein
MKITCENGHTFERKSNCIVCPTCSLAAHRDHLFLGQFSGPAQRALFNAGLTSLKSVLELNIKSLAKLHGIGKATISKIEQLRKDEII